MARSVRSRFCQCSVILLLALFSLMVTRDGAAQNRLSDKDVEKMMENLKNDAKQLKSDGDSAVGKSTIKGTDQEKQFKSLLDQFQKQTENMHDHFKSKKNADSDMKAVRESADEIDKSLTANPLGDKVNAQWSRVKSEMDTLSKAFGIEPVAAK